MKTGFFEEQPGVKSSTRLIMICGVFWSLIMGSVLILKQHTAPMEVAGFVSAIVAVFGGIKIAVGATAEKT